MLRSVSIWELLFDIVKTPQRVIETEKICMGLMFVCQEIANIAHEHGALLVIDNSTMSPILSKPLELGAGKGPYASIGSYMSF